MQTKRRFQCTGRLARCNSTASYFSIGLGLFQFFLGGVVAAGLQAQSGHAADLPVNACSRTADRLYFACRKDIHAEFHEGYAVCLNTSEARERRECQGENRAEFRESREECGRILQARRNVCGAIGEAPYDPPFGEAYAGGFVNPLEIGHGIPPNPYFPLIQGSQWEYESTVIGEDGEKVTETIAVTVTGKTKLIDGVDCVVVNDLVKEDGEVIENTEDWYAQDIEGNVWYCGEIAGNYEHFDGDEPQDPELVDIEGSWKAGREGAKAGILLPAQPQAGATLRQEAAWDEAEDVIEVLSLTGTESSPAASCVNDCLVTRDYTPLEPGVNEHKFYKPGVGLILEVDDQNNRVELMRYTR